MKMKYFFKIACPFQKNFNTIKKFVLFVFLSCSFSGNFFAQCTSPPAVGSCSPAGSTPLVNNDVVSSGQVKTVNTNAALGTPTISGGKLIVCANLTLTEISFSSGTIIINPGASLSMNPSSSLVFGTNCVIYNYGNFSTTTSMVMGQSNLIMNCSLSSVFNVLFNQLIIQGPNSYLINYGLVTASYFIVSSSNSPNPICMDAGAMVSTNILINQYANSIAAPNPSACIYISSQINNNQPLTSSSNLVACYPNGISIIGGSANLGSATVNNPCVSCSAALPLKLLSFGATCQDQKVDLHWLSQEDDQVGSFEIQRSTDGLNFEQIGVHEAKKTHKNFNEYRFIDSNIPVDVGTIYYRLKENDINGTDYLSPVVAANCKSGDFLHLIPEVISGDVCTIISSQPIVAVSIFDMLGHEVLQKKANNNTTVVVDVSDVLSKGCYTVIIRTVTGVTSWKKIIVQ